MLCFSQKKEGNESKENSNFILKAGRSDVVVEEPSRVSILLSVEENKHYKPHLSQAEPIRDKCRGGRLSRYRAFNPWTKKDTNPLMSSFLVIFVWGSEAIL
jgi:hypothetical protein